MNLWKFTRGYVKIKLRCERPERMVNILLAEGICLHNAERCSLHEFTAIVRLKCYMQLCDILSAHGGEVTLIEEHGLPVYAKLIKGRPVLAAVLLLGFAAILFASRRVLVIRTEGCDSVSERAVLDVLEANGARPGAGRTDIRLDELNRALLDSDGRIGFADVRLEGVTLTAVIHEIDSLVGAAEDDAPSSIFADKDCVIVSIAAEDGNAMVKRGRAVKRGELLVSGDITPEGASTPVRVHARAEIYGQAAYRFSVLVAPTAERPVRSGSFCDYTELSAFGLRLGSRVPYEMFEVELAGRVPLDACGIPLDASSGRAYELVSGMTELTKEEMQNAALAEADGQIRRTVPKDARIIMKTTELVWQDDGSLIAVVRVQTIEKIGYSRYI